MLSHHDRFKHLNKPKEPGVKIVCTYRGSLGLGTTCSDGDLMPGDVAEVPEVEARHLVHIGHVKRATDEVVEAVRKEVREAEARG